MPKHDPLGAGPPVVMKVHQFDALTATLRQARKLCQNLKAELEQAEDEWNAADLALREFVERAQA